MHGNFSRVQNRSTQNVNEGLNAGDQGNCSSWTVHSAWVYAQLKLSDLWDCCLACLSGKGLARLLIQKKPACSHPGEATSALVSPFMPTDSMVMAAYAESSDSVASDSPVSLGFLDRPTKRLPNQVKLVIVELTLGLRLRDAPPHLSRRLPSRGRPASP